jgi:hypothetical protein
MMNHLEQKVAGLKESLTNAGIGAAYHRKTLCETAPDLFGQITTLIDDANNGKGIIFTGETRAYDETVVTARALQLSGVPCFITHLTRLLCWIEVDADQLHRLDEVQALFLLRFSAEGESPFTNYQRQRIEDFLEARIDSGHAFFAQVSGTLRGSRWWSEGFVKRILSATSVRVCNEPRAIAS